MHGTYQNTFFICKLSTSVFISILRLQIKIFDTKNIQQVQYESSWKGPKGLQEEAANIIIDNKI